MADEKVNGNRQVPFPNPDIKVGKVEPDNSPSPKNIGGGPINNDSYKWKDVQNAQLKRNKRD